MSNAIKSESVKRALSKLYDLQERREDIAFLLEPIIELLDKAVSEKKKSSALSPREAVDYAVATMRLEGFHFSSEEHTDLERLAQGLVTTEQLRNSVFAELDDLQKKSPKMFIKCKSRSEDCYGH